MPTTPIIVLTGATSGIGQLAAIELAKQGAHLVIIARNADKADATRALIDEAAPGSPCDVFFADLAIMDDVRRVGQEIAAHYERIDVLINNAGIHPFEQRVTCDGFPEAVAVNYFGPWLLTFAQAPLESLALLLKHRNTTAPSLFPTISSTQLHSAYSAH